MSVVIGIDPGANTGVAVYKDGHLIDLYTKCHEQALLFVRTHKPSLVVLEDSTLQSHLFAGTGLNRAAAIKVARNVGEIDAYCKLIKQYCASLGIPYLSMSPKQKGKKMARKEFDALTGCSIPSNQHERDAAMVAWSLRNTKDASCE